MKIYIENCEVNVKNYLREINSSKPEGTVLTLGWGQLAQIADLLQDTEGTIAQDGNAPWRNCVHCAGRLRRLQARNLRW